jgi:hypothetical protein
MNGHASNRAKHVPITNNAIEIPASGGRRVKDRGVTCRAKAEESIMGTKSFHHHD